MLFGQFACGREITKALEIGSFRVFVSLFHFIDQSAGVERKAGVQLFTADVTRSNWRKS